MTQIKAPTKDEEIAILRRAIAALGDNSYLGPFLREQLPFMESCIRSDMPPTPLHQAQRMCNEIISQAEKDAREKTDRTRKECDAMIAKARKEVHDIKGQAEFTLRSLANQINPRTH